ncbi:1-phosphofructokinase family hexose kinase [Dermacoccaceae bacterium W4C1]
MILTLTPNPAWDVTLRVPQLTPGESLRTGPALRRAGGKGVNTASVLHLLDHRATALVVAGADDGAAFGQDLRRRGIPHRVLSTPGRTRTSTTVVDDEGVATVFNEPGLPWSSETVDQLRTAAMELTTSGDVVTLSGSAPPSSEHLVAALIADLSDRRLVLDLQGQALLKSLRLSPALVKPNRSEAAAALGNPGASAQWSARRLVELGAQAAAVSDGANGMTLATGGRIWHAATAAPLAGNPTGAGDAATAAFASGLGSPRIPWEDLLVRAVAWSAAAVLAPVAGEVAREDIAVTTSSVSVKEIHP